MDLATYIAERKQSKDLLVMAHVVCGYPSFDDNLKALEIMAEAGGRLGGAAVSLLRTQCRWSAVCQS